MVRLRFALPSGTDLDRPARYSNYDNSFSGCNRAPLKFKQGIRIILHTKAWTIAHRGQKGKEHFGSKNHFKIFETQLLRFTSRLISTT